MEAVMYTKTDIPLQRKNARMVGLFYLALAVLGPFSLVYVSSRLVVPGDAVATAQKIMASEGLFRTGMLIDVIICFIEVAVSIMLYQLFKPVNQTVSLISASLRLTMAVIQGINLLNKFIVLFVLGGAGYLKVFEPSQLNALAMLFVNANGAVVLIWQAFFGLHCLVLGYLVYRSGFIPQIFGILLAIAGLAYLSDSFGNFLVANYKQMFGWVVAVAATVGELSFMLWLLIKGVQDQRPAMKTS